MDGWSPDRLIDRLQIQEQLHLYCRAIDRIQPDLLASLFHADAIIDKGDGPMPAARFVTAVAARHPGVPRASHMVTNHLIDFLGADTAFVESWCLALEQHPPAGTETRTIDRIYRVRYGDRFERRESRWRIAARTSVVDHVLSAPVDPTLMSDGGGRFEGRRDADDVILALRRATIEG